MTNLKFISGTGTTTVIPTNNNNDVEIRLPSNSCTLGTKEEIDNIDKYLFTNRNVTIFVNDTNAKYSFPTLKEAIQEALKYRLVDNRETRVFIKIQKDLNEYPIEINYKLLNNITISTDNVKRRWVVKNTNSKEDTTLIAFTTSRCSGILEFNSFNMELEPEISNQQLLFFLAVDTDVLFWYCNIRVLLTLVLNPWNGVINAANNGFVNIMYTVLYVKLREPTYAYNRQLNAIILSAQNHGKIGCFRADYSRDYFTKIVIEEPDVYVNPNNSLVTINMLSVRTEGTIASRGIILAWVGNNKKEAPLLTRAKNRPSYRCYINFLVSYSAGVIAFDYFEIGIYNITANLKPSSPEENNITLLSADRMGTNKLVMINSNAENLVLKAAGNTDTLNITGGKGILKVITPRINAINGGMNYIAFGDKFVTVDNATQQLYSNIPFNTYNKTGMNYIFNHV